MNLYPEEVNMQERKINLELTIKFYSPFIIGSGFGLAGLIDLTTIKDTSNIIYIPASSLKGKIRSEFKKVMEAIGVKVCNSIVTSKKEICKESNIRDACVICRIFGSEFYPGSLIFEDAVMNDNTKAILIKMVRDRVVPAFQSTVRTGIKINRHLRTADEGALYTMESVNPSIIFTSRITGRCYIKDNDEYSYFKETIRMITHLGGNKARGMGRCKIEVRELDGNEKDHSYDNQ